VVGEAFVRHLRLAGVVPSRHGCRHVVCHASSVQPIRLANALGHSEAIGSIRTAGALAAGELWPVKVVAAVVNVGAEAD
jgi:hypothetical protein